MDTGDLGVYVHVPFCARVCPYCEFAVVAARTLPPAREQAYVDALLCELERRAPAFARADAGGGGRPLASLYFGGGTPSLLTPASIGRLVAAVRAQFPPGGEVEVTLEVNPGTTERTRLPAFRAAGVNRLSIGVQSFSDATLKRLGRAHRTAESRATLTAARAAGFDNLSLDLITAAPGQRLADLERDLDEALAFAPEHVSAYQLTIEPGTPFALAARRGQLALADEEEATQMLEQLAARLAAAGLPRYEISSFARPGRTARHNRRYWERRAVLAIGVGACSYEPPSSAAPHGLRRENLRSLEAYLARIAAGAPADAGAPDVLDAASARGEAAFLSLRSAAGLDAARFRSEFGAPPRSFWPEAIDELAGAGLLSETSAGDLRLTPRGILLSNAVFACFV
ncbi:radical SAM family heme chaperone HemW [Myxococcota bacterium]|nr:radical SAM family heme chaperone HemW [Myxococcota bacterium]MCZ7620137.1 radical SAM family heme chaperone HemW [Myxococcota bacterium]